jgi:hypothetical protein
MTRFTTSVIGAACVACAAQAGGLIDFETLPDGTPTTDQQEIGLEYAAMGVTFTLIDAAGDPAGTPNIAKVGSPLTAFESCNGDDTPLPGQGLGNSFLTDDTSVGHSGDLLITYASPVAQVAGVILDIDCRDCTNEGTCGDCEQWTIEARDAGDNVIDTFVIDGPVGPPSPPCFDTTGPGDAVASGWFFDHATADIASVVIRYTGTATGVGLAFDNFTPASIPELEATADATPSSICFGEAVTLTGTASGGVPPYTYTWQQETSPGVWADVATGQSVTVGPPQDTQYRLIVDDVANGSVTTDALAVDVEAVVYEISQESAPGAGDFADHVLGSIQPYVSAEAAAEYYGWSSGTNWFSGPDPPLTDNRSHLFMVAGSDGLALYVVHDDHAGGAGGRAETEVNNGCETANFMVRDDSNDANDIFNELDGGSLFQARNVWLGSRTDGYAIGVLNCAWSAVIRFTDLFSGAPTFDGLDSWVAYSAGGGQIALALEEDRRVRITAIIGCPADLDGDGIVNVVDFLILLAEWGPCDCCDADLDQDGTVGIIDFLSMLAQWGPCP